jgi:putative transposase
MTEITCFMAYSGWIGLNFVERERTPSELIKLVIRYHLSRLSLLNAVRELENFGVQRSLKAVHDWAQEADLQPASIVSPDHIALDKTVIRVNVQRYWLYAAVDPETNEFLHTRLLITTATALTQKLLRELRAKHDMSETVFLVEHAHHHSAALN